MMADILKYVVLVMLLFLLAGCGHNKIWVKQGASEEDRRKADGYGKMHAASVPNVSWLQGMIAYEGCMQAMGGNK